MGERVGSMWWIILLFVHSTGVKGQHVVNRMTPNQTELCAEGSLVDYRILLECDRATDYLHIKDMYVRTVLDGNGGSSAECWSNEQTLRLRCFTDLTAKVADECEGHTGSCLLELNNFDHHCSDANHFHASFNCIDEEYVKPMCHGGSMELSNSHSLYLMVDGFGSDRPLPSEEVCTCQIIVEKALELTAVTHYMDIEDVENGFCYYDSWEIYADEDVNSAKHCGKETYSQTLNIAKYLTVSVSFDPLNDDERVTYRGGWFEIIGLPSSYELSCFTSNWKTISAEITWTVITSSPIYTAEVTSPKTPPSPPPRRIKDTTMTGTSPHSAETTTLHHPDLRPHETVEFSIGMSILGAALVIAAGVVIIVIILKKINRQVNHHQNPLGGEVYNYDNDASQGHEYESVRPKMGNNNNNNNNNNTNQHEQRAHSNTIYYNGMINSGRDCAAIV